MSHEQINPAPLAPAVGFSHAVKAAPGTTYYLGGQTAQRPDGGIQGATLVEQFDLALSNVDAVLAGIGARPEHIVNMTVYTTDGDEYRARLKELGAVYRKHLGRHYPAMALFVVAGLFDPEALVELVCTVVVPD
jgi:enamine deaminase RidA (YjgF/YER057c/UK114 family)